MEETERAVVARIRAGDGDGFRVLVDRHSRSVFRLAYRMTGNEHDAEDVVQESFLRAYRSLNQFDDRAAFSTWLYRIASNCALDLLRGRKRYGDPEAGEGPVKQEWLAAVPAADLPADRMVYGAQLQQQLESALGTLSPQERTAFVLRHFEGNSIDEIATALEVKESAAKHSVFRAVQKLRRILQPLAGVSK